MAMKSIELLTKILASEDITVEDIDDMLQANVEEDLFLDYKDGAILNSKEKAAGTVREYISAFANSQGGVLIIGVQDKTYRITGCTPPGNSSLNEWAANSLAPIAAYLSPPPRIQTVKHSQGDILIIAVDRSILFVPLSINGTLHYFLRLGDQTRKAPEYLVTDLLVGRRKTPMLSIYNLSLTKGNREQHSRYPGIVKVDFDIYMSLENLNSFWVDDIKVGALYWSENPSRKIIGRNLRAYVNVVHNSIVSIKMHLNHTSSDVNSIGAFDVTPGIHIIRSLFVLNDHYSSTFYKYTWFSGIYILVRDLAPIWYQVEIDVDGETIHEVMAVSEDVSSPFRIKRLYNEAPKVGLVSVRT